MSSTDAFTAIVPSIVGSQTGGDSSLNLGITAVVLALATILVLAAKSLLKDIRKQPASETATSQYKRKDPESSRPGSVVLNIGNVTGGSSSSSSSSTTAAMPPPTPLSNPALVPNTPSSSTTVRPPSSPSIPVYADESQRPALADHEFFANMATIKAQQIDAIKCSGPNRTALVRDMCSDIIDSWMAEMQNLVRTYGDDAAASNAQTQKFLSHVRGITSRVEKEIHKKWRERGVPAPANDHMSRWYRSLSKIWVAHISSAASSLYFSDIRSRANGVLLVLNVAADTSFQLAKFQLRKINGELTGHPYQGGIIEAFHYDERDDSSDHIPTGAHRSISAVDPHAATKRFTRPTT